MGRPLGPHELQLLIGVPGHGPPVAVHDVMVMEAHERKVVEVGLASRFPRHDVMHIGEGHVGASGKPAVAVSPHHLPALGIGRESPGPALVHGVADVIVDGDGDGGVARHPLHGLAIDQAVPLELPGELGGFDGVVDERVERDVDDDEVRAARVAFPDGTAAFDELTMPVKASQRRWSQGVSPSVGTWRAAASNVVRTSA